MIKIGILNLQGCKVNNLKNHFYNFRLDKWQTTYKGNINKNISDQLNLSSIRPYGKWYENRFNSIQANYFCYLGIFSIGKNDIIQHSINKYKILLNELEYLNPEVGHYIERRGGVIFYPFNDTQFISYLPEPLNSIICKLNYINNLHP